MSMDEPANLGFDPDPSSAFLRGAPDGRGRCPEELHVRRKRRPTRTRFCPPAKGRTSSWSTLTTNLAIPVAENTRRLQRRMATPKDQTTTSPPSTSAGVGDHCPGGACLSSARTSESASVTPTSKNASVSAQPSDHGATPSRLNGTYHRYSSVDAPVAGTAKPSSRRSRSMDSESDCRQTSWVHWPGPRVRLRCGHHRGSYVAESRQ